MLLVVEQIGTGVRTLVKGYVPPTPFLIVSTISTLFLLGSWRAGYAKISPAKPLAKGKKGDTSKGNVFEFFQLLTSLVKRW